MEECIIKQMVGRADKTNFKKEDADTKELEMGIKVEMEHTDNPEIAEKIALDHLSEFKNYYSLLKEMEAKAIPYKKENVITKEKLRKVLLQTKKEMNMFTCPICNRKILQLPNAPDAIQNHLNGHNKDHDKQDASEENNDDCAYCGNKFHKGDSKDNKCQSCKNSEKESLTTSNSGSLTVKQISKNKNRNKIRKVIKSMGFEFGKK